MLNVYSRMQTFSFVYLVKRINEMNMFRPLLKAYLAFAILLCSITAFGADTLSAKQNLAQVLNKDGSLRTGINGSFNASGYSMEYGKNGQPFFKEAKVNALGDENWVNKLSSGLLTNINVVAVNGSDVYIGSNNIYKWDGTGWSILGDGVSNSGNSSQVTAITISGTDVYVGGYFSQAGSISAFSIAKWNGTSWNALGMGLPSGTVYAIAVSGTDVYAGGNFAFAGSNTANNIAKWDGTSWSSFGSGTSGEVRAIAVSGTDVYIGGYFNLAGGNATNNIAKWNGSYWTALGSGANNGVLAIAISGSTVYAGGKFTYIGNIPANYIAKWDGTTWAPLGTGINGQAVYSLAISGSNLYAAGNFFTAGGINANSIAKWNGTTWSDVGANTNLNGSNIYSIAVSGANLYAVGDVFINNNKIIKWNGTAWSSVGDMLENYVRAVAISGNDVYVGGGFISVAGITNAKYIAKWNGTSWSALGTGLSDLVTSIAISGTDVYVGGRFIGAGGNTVNYIAKWNGSSWSSLGSGLNQPCQSLIAVGADIYAGGNFTNAGGNTANYIAKWNGTTWSALGSGTNGTVSCIASLGTDIYVGGSFTTAGGNATNYIAKWNGTAWNALGSGLGLSYATPQVNAIAPSTTSIYVGGGFDIAGGKIAQYLAEYKTGILPLNMLSFTVGINGKDALLKWQTGNEVNVDHFNIQRSLNGYDFTTIGKLPAVGSGNNFYEYANDVSVLNSSVIYFRLQSVDKDGSFSFSNVVNVKTTKVGSYSIYPNPAQKRVTIIGYNISAVTVINLEGKILGTEAFGSTNNPTINISQYPKGTYFLKVRDSKDNFTTLQLLIQ